MPEPTPLEVQVVANRPLRPLDIVEQSGQP